MPSPSIVMLVFLFALQYALVVAVNTLFASRFAAVVVTIVIPIVPYTM